MPIQSWMGQETPAHLILHHVISRLVSPIRKRIPCNRQIRYRSHASVIRYSHSTGRFKSPSSPITLCLAATAANQRMPSPSEPGSSSLAAPPCSLPFPTHRCRCHILASGGTRQYRSKEGDWARLVCNQISASCSESRAVSIVKIGRDKLQRWPSMAKRAINLSL